MLFIENRKSFSLPTEIIVVAVMLLVVAIIVFALFSRQAGEFIAGLKDCRQSGTGECMTTCDVPLKGFKCDGRNEKCCLRKPDLV